MVSVVLKLLLMGKAPRIVYLKVFVMPSDCTVLVSTLSSHFFLKTGIVLFMFHSVKGTRCFLIACDTIKRHLLVMSWVKLKELKFTDFYSMAITEVVLSLFYKWCWFDLFFFNDIAIFFFLSTISGPPGCVWNQCVSKIQ